MNSSINILDQNGQSKNVELISYFKLSNNKNYIFYSNGEIVQDGLIKMYVASEFVDLSNGLTEEEWTTLKKTMQNIITGNISDIKFLNYTNQVRFNESKAIALSQTNIDIIKKVYNESSKEEIMLNKDLLSNSFSTNVEPVQISSIPTLENGPSLENEPVNLNTVPSVETVSQVPETGQLQPELGAINNSVMPEVPKMPEIPSITNVGDISNVSGLNNTGFENINDLDKFKIDDNINMPNISSSGIDSGFKVSDQPNIFDQVTPITNTLDELNNSNVVPEPHLFNSSNVNDDNDMSKLIEINEKKAKLYEELASLYREENKLYENKNVNLEHTASNLFNNNGALDINNL